MTVIANRELAQGPVLHPYAIVRPRSIRCAIQRGTQNTIRMQLTAALYKAHRQLPSFFVSDITRHLVSVTTHLRYRASLACGHTRATYIELFNSINWTCWTSESHGHSVTSLTQYCSAFPVSHCHLLSTWQMQAKTVFTNPRVCLNIPYSVLHITPAKLEFLA